MCRLASRTNIHLPRSSSTIWRSSVRCLRVYTLTADFSDPIKIIPHWKDWLAFHLGGTITFISQLYTGHISDREIVTRLGFLNLPFWQMRFCHGRWGIYCRGSSRLWGLPEYTTFLGNKGQMSPDEVLETQSIASLCIHVEREINKIKYFHIWDSAEPFTMFGVVNQIWSLCAMLCNFRNSIIST